MAFFGGAKSAGFGVSDVRRLLVPIAVELGAEEALRLLGAAVLVAGRTPKRRRRTRSMIQDALAQRVELGLSMKATVVTREDCSLYQAVRKHVGPFGAVAEHFARTGRLPGK